MSRHLHLGLNLKSLLLLVPHQSGAAESTLTERLVRALMHSWRNSLDS